MIRYLEGPVFFGMVLILFAGFKLWLISEFAIYGETWAGHDDRHFVNQAAYILQGHWLGAYNQLTLIKGPVYPLWLALLDQSHIPLLSGQEVVYILVCCGFAVSIKNHSGSFIIGALCFIVAVLYLDVIPRVVREGLYVSLSFGIFVSLAFCHQSLTGRRVHFILQLSILGILLSLFWLTREEGVWLLPSLLICFAYFIYQIAIHIDLSVRERLIRTLLLLLPAIILSVALCSVKLINGHYYQSYNIVEMNDAAFVGAYGSLSRVIPVKKIPYVPVSRAVRKKIYQVSPHFRLLEHHLEGSGPWEAISCETYHDLCGEIAGGWFMWALRDAVAAAGFYQNGATAREFYLNLKREIDRACSQKKLSCMAERNTLLPVIAVDEWVHRVWASFQLGMRYIIELRMFEPIYLRNQFLIKNSTGDQASLDFFKSVVIGEFAPIEEPSMEPYIKRKWDTWQFPLSAKLTQFYVFWWPWALASALLLYAFDLFNSLAHQRLPFYLVFNTSLLVAIVARVAILAIIDATSFQGITEIYLSPAYPLVLAWILSSYVRAWLRLKISGAS